MLCDRVIKITEHGICAECEKDLRYIEEPRCYICGRELDAFDEEYCPDCKAKERFFDGGFPLLHYVPPVSDSVAAIKYRGKKEYVSFYAERIAARFGETFGMLGVEGLVPIPIHKNRLKKRGFNQAGLLADEISGLTGLPVLDILERRIDTIPQKTLGNEERFKNLEKALCLKTADMEGKRLLIVDDIFTTGSTVNAAAKILKAAGAKKVYYTSICRA